MHPVPRAARRRFVRRPGNRLAGTLTDEVADEHRPVRRDEREVVPPWTRRQQRLPAAVTGQGLSKLVGAVSEALKGVLAGAAS